MLGPTRELVRTLNQRARTTASQVSLRGRQVDLADANRASVVLSRLQMIKRGRPWTVR